MCGAPPIFIGPTHAVIIHTPPMHGHLINDIIYIPPTQLAIAQHRNGKTRNQ